MSVEGRVPYLGLSTVLKSPVCEKTEHRWWSALIRHLTQENPWRLEERSVVAYDPFQQEFFKAQAVQKAGSKRRNESANLIITQGQAAGAVCVDLTKEVDKKNFLYNWQLPDSAELSLADIAVVRMIRVCPEVSYTVALEVLQTNLSNKRELYEQALAGQPGWFICSLFQFLLRLDIQYDAGQIEKNVFTTSRVSFSQPE